MSESTPQSPPAPVEPSYTPPPGEPTPPAEPPLPARRSWPIVVAILAAAAVLAIFATVLALDEDDPPRVVLPEPSDIPPLSPTASELVDLLNQGRTRTYHVKYGLTGASGVTGIEQWNQSGRSRIDTVNEAEGTRVLTASILDGTQAFACRRDGEDAWACSRIETPPSGRLPGFFDTVEAQLRGRSVKASSETIEGRQARCFSLGAVTTEPGGEPVEMCVTTEGIPIRVATQTASIYAEVVDADIPAGIFAPPAPPG